MLRYNKRLAALWFIVTCTSATRAAVIYVDASAMGGCDGSSWVDAFTDLQDGLLLAQSGDEIWVAAGIYTPDRGSGDRTMSFELKGGVMLLGGFAGWEIASFQRFPEINRTILSGDLSGDDDPNGSSNNGSSDCCTRHDSPGCDDPVCEQIICEESSASGCCGIHSGRRWHITCAAFARSLCCDLCSSKNNCENSLHVVRAQGVTMQTTLDGFTITSGRADVADVNAFAGGGLLIENSDVVIRQCTVQDNIGGGLHARDSTIDMEHCNYVENEDCGAALNNVTGTVERVYFARNVGGGMSLFNNSPVMRDCLFEANRSLGGGAVFIGFGAQPAMVGCVFLNNIASIDGITPNGSGGAIHNGGNFTTLLNCSFFGNEGDGAAIDNDGGLLAVNCLFNGNRREPIFGGGSVISNLFGVAAVRNCTIVNNCAAAFSAIESLDVGGSILWGNKKHMSFARIEKDSTIVSYSALEDLASLQTFFPSAFGPGNTDADPMFVDLLGPDGLPGTGDEDLRLSAASPLINQGDPMPDVTPAADLDGHTRNLCGRVDMGAYEFGIGDFDCNRVVNLTDFAAWSACMTDPNDATASTACLAFDFDADDDVDLADLAALANTLAGTP